jgi:hypothetical protein
MKTDAQMARTDAQMAETSAQMARTDEQMAKTDKRFKEIQEELGGIGNNNGAFAEDYFASSLEDKMEFAGQKYTEIERNVNRKSKRAGLRDQYDIVLFNGTSVALIEVKYTAQTKDLEKMVNKKLPNFRALFPIYGNHKIYLGLGSFSIDDHVYKKAKELGIGLLHQQGDTIEADTAHVRAY